MHTVRLRKLANFINKYNYIIRDITSVQSHSRYRCCCHIHVIVLLQYTCCMPASYYFCCLAAYNNEQMMVTNGGVGRGVYRSEPRWSSTANRRSVCLRPRTSPWTLPFNQWPWKRHRFPTTPVQRFTRQLSSQDFHGRHSVSLTFDPVTLKKFCAVSDHMMIVCGKL